MTQRRFLIVAKNRHLAQRLIREHERETRLYVNENAWVYVADATRLRGYDRDTPIVCEESWIEHDDFEELEALIAHRGFPRMTIGEAFLWLAEREWMKPGKEGAA